VDRLAVIERFAKLGSAMSQARRESLPTKAFAIPETKAKKIGVGGEIKGEAKGKYPIPDEKHARNALARVSQKGTPAERQAVRSKVYSKFPGLKEGFQERHGESPTAKGNIAKKEQGGIGKTAEAVRYAALFSELEKIGGISPLMLEMLKEAGLFSRAGMATKKGVEAAGKKARDLYNAAQVGTGDLMTGSFGHAGEHAAQKLMTTASPTKALLVAAADPHAQKAVLRGAQNVGRRIQTGAENLLANTRAALGTGGPPMVPSFAG